MIERLWRLLKYECVYLNAFETGSEARRGIGAWLGYDNEKRPHSSQGLLTPAEAHDTRDPNMKAAAGNETNAMLSAATSWSKNQDHLCTTRS